MSISLRAPLPSDYEALASWITDAAACKRWAGSRVTFPFSAFELPQLLVVAGAVSYTLADGSHAPCGFGQHWLHKSGAAHLGRIIVSPALRGKGYGRELVNQLKVRALQVTGASAVSLNVYRDNFVALNLYRSLGFAPIESESTQAALFMTTQPDAALPLATASGRLNVHTHHAIDYIEFTVRDLVAAKRFYAEAFGWTFADYGPDYAGIQGAEREVGGLHRTDELRSGGPLVILYSDDLARSLAAVRAAGGQVIQEPYAFPGGRRFHFTDPSGNELAVWSST